VTTPIVGKLEVVHIDDGKRQELLGSRRVRNLTTDFLLVFSVIAQSCE